MKYHYETEEEFIARQKEAKSRGECVFRDDNNREMILDIIDDYLDIVDVLQINQERSNSENKRRNKNFYD